MRELKVNDPVRITGDMDFPTSLGLVKAGSIGRVIGFAHAYGENPPRIHIEVYGPDVKLYLPEQFVEYHQPPDDEYR